MKYEEFRKLSYRKLADLSGDSRSSWWNWLNLPDQSPTVNAIEAIAKSLQEDGKKVTGETLYKYIVRRRREAIDQGQQAA